MGRDEKLEILHHVRGFAIDKTVRRAGGQAGRQAEREACRQRGTQADRHRKERDRQTDKKTDRQTDRQTEKQTDRQDRQIDRHKHTRQAGRQTEKAERAKAHVGGVGCFFRGRPSCNKKTDSTQCTTKKQNRGANRNSNKRFSCFTTCDVTWSKMVSEKRTATRKTKRTSPLSTSEELGVFNLKCALINITRYERSIKPTDNEK